MPDNNTSRLENDVLATLTSDQLISRGDVIVLGVSGGPDSAALLHVLCSIRHSIGFTIIVAHFNHRIRSQAKRDEKFVHKLAQELGLQCIVERSKFKPPRTGSLEDWARRQRLAFLIKTVKRYKAQSIVLAHTSDDLAETIIMRILRGSGLMGLKGMSQSSFMHGVRVVRPFLSVTKSDILQYLKKQHLDFCCDETNLKTDFFRNKIRLKLLPLLNKEYNVNIRKALTQLSRCVSDDYEVLSQMASQIWPRVANVSSKSDKGVKINAERLMEIHPAIQRIILRMAFEYLKGDLNQLTFDHVHELERLLLKSSGAKDLPGSVSVKRDQKYLSFYRR